jgi:diguanylate cyclase (GGDEF)-like protein
MHPEMPRRRLTPMIGLLLILLCAVIAALVASDRYFQSQLIEVQSRTQVIVRDVERIRYYDEVLTGSARLAASTGDVSYQRRYHDRAPELDAVIAEALRVARSPQAIAAIKQTDAANRALVKMEERSFTLDNQGREDAALLLLTSPRYLEQKQVYAQGFNRAISIILGTVRADIARVRSYRRLGLGVGLLGGLILLVAGGLLLRLSRERDRLGEGLRAESATNAYNSLHDVLTGLPNRALFSDRLEHRLRSANRDPSPFSVLAFDLDRFKEINDTLGHSTGDYLLREIDSRVRPALRSGDTLARIGGDEFAVLLPAADGDHALRVAGRLLSALREPFTLDHLRVSVGASIGIVTFPTHGEDGETLVQRADVAMYLAKGNGLGVSVYDRSADPYNPERLALVGELRSAIAAEELELYYQPLFDTADMHVGAVEALARWRHPTRGMRSPDEFIPIAEQTGLIKPLTMLVTRMAARQCREWNESGLALTVAVNLSAENLLDLELVDDVARILDEERLPAGRLEIEVTESMVMVDPERATAQLRRLSAMGIRLAIDDFGTGHSSLAYLRSLPVSDLKIDRAFIRDLATSEDDAAIVRSTIELAHQLGLRVVAEGVEDAASLTILQELNCDRAQGFHLCRPAPAEQLLAQLQRHSRRVPRPTPAGAI